jgi:thymidylate kinase
MKCFYALEGTAATTKTTILKKLIQLRPTIKVHLTDYKEITDEYLSAELMTSERKNNALNGMFFVLTRGLSLTSDMMKYPQQIHVYDRTPESSLIYQMIFANLFLINNGNAFDETGLRLYIQAIKEMKKTLHFNYCALVMVCKQGQEALCVDVMRKRDNKIDILTKEYVDVQNRVFRIYADEMNYPVFEVDYTRSLDEQQNEISHFLNVMIENSDEMLKHTTKL